MTGGRPYYALVARYLEIPEPVVEHQIATRPETGRPRRRQRGFSHFEECSYAFAMIVSILKIFGLGRRNKVTVVDHKSSSVAIAFQLSTGNAKMSCRMP